MHERSAKNITRKNTLRAYNRVYRSDSLLAEYLAPPRLDFYDEVAEICAPLTPRRVIDVGCGTGHLLRSLLDRMAVAPELVVGVDRSRTGIRRAGALLPTAKFIVADLYRLPLGGERFDLVLCTEVLEHVREPARAVDALCRLCAPGGRCYHRSRRRAGLMEGTRQLLGRGRVSCVSRASRSRCHRQDRGRGNLPCLARARKPLARLSSRASSSIRSRVLPCSTARNHRVYEDVDETIEDAFTCASERKDSGVQEAKGATGSCEAGP
jgi:SAM-dependent methyltransferase